MKNNSEKVTILAFETSFDETAAAISVGRCIKSSVLTSSTNLHEKWGGVVPDIARRAHIENIEPIFKETLTRVSLLSKRSSYASIESYIDAVMKKKIDYIAVTYGPGLAIELEVGINFAKQLALKYNKPLLPINHMEGHLLSPFILNSRCNGQLKNFEKEDIFPAIAFLISGNHTELILVEDFGKYGKIGETLDDACGEAFDKVGRMLDLGFPGGPIVSELAKKGDSSFDLPVPMAKSNDLSFSFSGLKTACMYKIQDIKSQNLQYEGWVNDFCTSFVNTVIKMFTIKLQKAIKMYPKVKTLLVGGGVIMSDSIVKSLGRVAREHKLHFFYPERKYRTDNAGMIAIAGYFGLKHNYMRPLMTQSEIENLDRVPRLEIPRLQGSLS